MRFDMWKSKAQKGAFLVVAALMVPVFFLFGALAMDLGEIWAYYSKMQNAVDAAALAGASNFLESEGDKIDGIGKIDVVNHAHADAYAKRYLIENLGVDAVNQGTQKYLAKSVQDDENHSTHSYYRVEASQPIPLIFMRIIGQDEFTVKVAAVSLIGTTHQGDGMQFSPLFAAKNGLWGNFNSDNRNQIHNTYDGDMVVADKTFYDAHVNDEKYKFFIGDAFGKNYNEVNNENWYKRMKYQESSDFDDIAEKTDAAIKKIISDNRYTYDGLNYEGDQNYNRMKIPFLNRDYSYYYINTDAGNFDIDLYNIPGDVNKPVYIYIEGKKSQIQVNLQANIERPVIFCYLGHANYGERNEWYIQTDSTFKMAANGYNFNGMVYTPYAHAEINFDGRSTFTGSVYAGSINFPSNWGKFVYKDYHVLQGSSGSSGGSGSSPDDSNDNVRLINNNAISWDQ